MEFLGNKTWTSSKIPVGEKVSGFTRTHLDEERKKKRLFIMSFQLCRFIITLPMGQRTTPAS